jgi:hypothetical protein
MDIIDRAQHPVLARRGAERRAILAHGNVEVRSVVRAIAVRGELQLERCQWAPGVADALRDPVESAQKPRSEAILHRFGHRRGQRDSLQRVDAACGAALAGDGRGLERIGVGQHPPEQLLALGLGQEAAQLNEGRQRR